MIVRVLARFRVGITPNGACSPMTAGKMLERDRRNVLVTSPEIIDVLVATVIGRPITIASHWSRKVMYNDSRVGAAAVSADGRQSSMHHAKTTAVHVRYDMLVSA